MFLIFSSAFNYNERCMKILKQTKLIFAGILNKGI